LVPRRVDEPELRARDAVVRDVLLRDDEPLLVELVRCAMLRRVLPLVAFFAAD
jgi:hypothetical protein